MLTLKLIKNLYHSKLVDSPGKIGKYYLPERECMERSTGKNRELFSNVDSKIFRTGVYYTIKFSYNFSKVAMNPVK